MNFISQNKEGISVHTFVRIILAVCRFCIVACYKYILMVTGKNYEKQKKKIILDIR